ncbi:hypothetical protein ScPMuIL_012075 [Solemya velum]
MADLQKLSIYGLLNDVSYHRARCCAEDLFKANPAQFSCPEVRGMLEFEWDLFIDSKKHEQRGETWQFEEKAICFIDEQLIGGPDNFIAWAEDNCCFEEFRPYALYETLTEKAYKTYLNTKNHDYVYMDISIGGEPAGRLTFELFSDIVPRTCTNFKALCTGEKGATEECKLTYQNTLFHRVVPNGWIQGGDIFLGRGNGGESIYGEVFEDENYALHHNKRGIIGMANKGRHTNASQFFIALQPSKWMDTKYVAFGQVIEGTETLRKMEEVETMNERPSKDIRVTSCGIMTYEF